jgi:hypothetical protein
LTTEAPGAIFGREENAMPVARAKSAKRRTVKIAGDRAAGGGAFMLDGDAVTRTTIPAFRLMVDVEPKGALKIREIDSASDSAIVDAAPEVANVDRDRALAAARERGRRRVAEILSDPDMLSADNLARLLGTTRATINTKRQNRQLLGLEGATRGFRFPSWQIGEDGKPFAALPTLFDRLGDSPWAVYRFLVQSHSELDGETGRDALRNGRTADVIEAAESVAETFA